MHDFEFRQTLTKKPSVIESSQQALEVMTVDISSN